MLLDSIYGPSDLKKLDIKRLPELASEIREILMNRLSDIGGHVGPNLGMVEATIAMHYVFNSPIDKMIFDVSHQCYVHKMLTGRKDAYLNPDRYFEVTGFTEPRESVHDIFTIGHTSTSISMACGIAKARDLVDGKENVIAIIGDGSLSGGEAYEGLNCASMLGTNFIVLLNDNEMAISNVNGGLYPHLKELRTSNGQCTSNIFKALGFDYIYIADGNDIDTMIEAFTNVKDINHPIVLHIHTTKGKGYKIAEKNKEGWHYHQAFNRETGEYKQKWQGLNIHAMLGDHLLEKMEKDPRVIAMAAAVPAAIGFNYPEKRKKAGKQFIDVDIAEQHLISMAAGIAKNGGKPVVGSDSTFFQRAYDQIAQDVCINKAPVTILTRNGSVWGATDVTHLGWFDLPLFGNIPNLVLLCPTNVEEYFAMVDWSIDQNEYPVMIKVPRNGDYHAIGDVQKDYSILNTNLVTRKGSQIAIFALGNFYSVGVELADLIKANLNLSVTLINPRYASGLDYELLENLKLKHQIIVTIEDGIIEGGYGQKISSYYGSSDIKVINFGLKKEFIDGKKSTDIMEENAITPKLIFDNISSLL